MTPLIHALIALALLGITGGTPRAPTTTVATESPRQFALAAADHAALPEVDSLALTDLADRAFPSNRALRVAYYFPQDPTSLDSLRANIRSLDLVALHTLTIDDTGTLHTIPATDAERFLRTTNVMVMPSVMVTSKAAGHEIVTVPEVANRAKSQLVEAAMAWDGLALDFEGLDAADRPYLSAFVNLIGQALHERGKYYAVALPAKTSDVKTGWAGSYDYAAIAQAADLYLVMAYGFTTSGSSVPGSTAPLPWMDRSMGYAVSEIPGDRLILGVPFYGYDWNVTKGPPARALRHRDTRQLLERTGAVPSIDPETASATFQYTEGNETHEVWYEDDRSLGPKLQLLRKYGLRGVGAWRLGQEDPKAWAVWDQMLASPSVVTSQVPQP